MLQKMIEQMLPPGALDEFVQGAQTAMRKIAEFDQTLARMERRLYNLEIDLQSLITGEAQAEKMTIEFAPHPDERKDDANGT